MVKFGLLTNPTKPIEKEIRTIHKLGFDYPEIGIEWPEGDVKILMQKRKKIIHELKRFKFQPLGHTSWWMDFTSPYELVRKAWIEEAKRKIIVAKSLGISFLNFHTSSRYNKLFYKTERTLILRNFVKSMKELIAFAEKNKVMLMLENAAESGEIASFTDFNYVLSQLPKSYVHLDIGHAKINGGMKSIRKFIINFNKRIEHVHIHDNHGKEDEHLPLGSGSIDFKNVIRQLKYIGYDKTITFEVFTSHKDAVRSRKFFKNLWNKIKV